jgi:LysR family transcriptional regulator, transcriptional activator of the cysJI operon
MADRRLQVFYTVAKVLSFTKAAEQLYMTQPAVTFQVKQLEEHFDTRLFERAHGRISLTPAGELAFTYAERILDQYAEMDARIAELTGQVSGPLLIGASTTIAEYLLPRLLGEFKQQHPDVKAKLAVANSDTIEHKVAEHSLDVGLIESPSHLPHLVTKVCCEDDLVLICSPKHPLAQKLSVTPREISEVEFVSREAGSGTREVVDDYFRSNGVAPEDIHIIMELGSREAIKGAVVAGMGVSIMSGAAVLKEMQLGELSVVALDPPLRRQLSLVYPEEKFQSKLLQSFLEFVQQASLLPENERARRLGAGFS